MTLERSRPESCLSDLQLDRLVAGELAAEVARAHLSSCAACRARVAELRRELAAFDVPAPWQAAPAPARARRSRRWIGAGALATFAAAAGLVLMLVHAPPPPPVRLKGGLVLELVARRSSGAVELVLPGAPLAPGDAVRFRVSSDRAGYLAIVGIDAARAVTPYAPADGDARAFGPARDALLDGSIILDETLGAERVVALLCPRALPVSAIVDAGKRALTAAHDNPAALGQLPLDCAQASRLIVKRSAP